MVKYLTVLLLFFCSLANAAEKNPWYEKVDGNIRLNVELFTKSDCPNCIRAIAFVNEQLKQQEWIALNIYTINESTDDLMLFHQRQKKLGDADYQVPSFFFCGVRYVGFRSAETSGKELLKSLEYCHKNIKDENQLSAATRKVLTRWSAGPFQQVKESEPFSWQNTFLMAFVDAIDPCSFFAIILFLSFVVLSPPGKSRLYLGLVMLMLMGLGHYMQQAAAVFYYHSLFWLRAFAVISAVAILWWLREIYSNGRFSLAASALVAASAFFITYLFQQSCLETNVSLSFQAWLQSLELPSWKTFAVQAVYQLFYLLPALLIFLLVLYLYGEKKSIRRRLFAQYTAMAFAALTAAVLIIHPAWLSSIMISILAALLSFILGWMKLWWKERNDG